MATLDCGANALRDPTWDDQHLRARWFLTAVRRSAGSGLTGSGARSYKRREPGATVPAVEETACTL